MGSLSFWHWIIVLVMLAFTFLPAIIAFRRRHTRKWLVLLVQFLTIIGWIIALIWAIKGETEEPTTSVDGVFE